MPGKEQHPPTGEPGERGKDREKQPAYLEVRRFPDAETAGRAYQESQQALHRERRDSDISLYRIQTGTDFRYHVVALGDVPSPMLQEQLEVALGLGERVTIDADVLAYLVARRAEAKQLGPWVEAHHRPGTPVHLEKRRGRNRGSGKGKKRR